MLQARIFNLLTLLIILQTLLVSSHRPRRSFAPFLGAGGSDPDKMGISKENWHCGNEGFTKNYTHDEVSKQCSSLAAAVNHCCAVHDDCYGQQAGQEFCDEQFCECNRLIHRIPTEESENCRSMLNTACTVVSFFGAYAYGDSNYTDPLKPSNVVPVAPKTVPLIEDDYLDLYTKCPYVNITLASCSFNFDLCASVHSVDFCAHDLCHCMLDAAESDPIHRKQCVAAVNRTCRLALKHSTEILTSKEEVNFNNLNLIILAILSAGGLMSGLIGVLLWRKLKKEEKNEAGKFLHIHTVESSRSVNPLLENTDGY